MFLCASVRELGGDNECTHAESQIFLFVSVCRARRSALVILTCSSAFAAWAAASARSACDSQSSSHALGTGVFLLILGVDVAEKLEVKMRKLWGCRKRVGPCGLGSRIFCVTQFDTISRIAVETNQNKEGIRFETAKRWAGWCMAFKEVVELNSISAYVQVKRTIPGGRTLKRQLRRLHIVCT